MVSLNVLVLAAAISAGGDDTMLLDFSADWCGPCKLMAPTMQRMEDDGFPVRRINVDQYPRLVGQWKVGPIPCYILVKNGREVERVVGAASYDRLVRMFEKSGYSAPQAEDAAGENRFARTVPPMPPRDVVRGQGPEPGLAQRMADAASGMVPRFGDSSTPRGATDTASVDWERVASEATVRLRVEESNGNSFGTGTIVDVHGEEALVVTCGHLFRESQGRSPIHVELLASGATGPVMGQLIAYEAEDRDIALVAIRPGRPVKPARVAINDESIRPGAAVFSLGCDHGGPLRVMRSRITTVDRYKGQRVYAHNIEVAGEPVDGRSGGGLFNEQGELIGVCNAADPTDKEGIYAGLRTIQWQLAEIGQERIYQGEVSTAASAAVPASAPAAPSDWTSQETRGAAASVAPPAADVAPQDPAPRPNLLTALESGAEVICIVRAPQQKDEVLVLDAESRALLTQLARSQGLSVIQATAPRADDISVRGQLRR